MRCARIDCGWTGFSCLAHNCPSNYAPGQPFQLTPTPSPRYLPVNVPFSNFGITTVTMDRDGNVTIKTDQPSPQGSEEANG